MAGGGGGFVGRLRRTRSAGEARAGRGTAQAGGSCRALAASPPRRRSERNARPSTQQKPCLSAGKMAITPHPGLVKTKTITLRKIVPQNRQVKETISTPRRSPRVSLKENKENVPVGTTVGQSPPTEGSRAECKPSSPPCASTPEAGKDVLSPVKDNRSDPALEEERDQAMAKRVRRSYSRLEISMSRSFLEKQPSPGSGLSDTSTPNQGPGKRQTLFGFEKLLVPDGMADVSPVNANTTQKETAAESSILREPDTDIPGVLLFKEKRKKKKMPQFDKSELEEWMAKMNAEFDEAEKFNLLVE